MNCGEYITFIPNMGWEGKIIGLVDYRKEKSIMCKHALYDVYTSGDKSKELKINSKITWKNTRKSTLEEIKWLNYCIKLGRFIEYDEFIKLPKVYELW